MTIILRMQGLDVKAGTEDIRTFFNCIHIPEGGVYIVGGSLREAFIAFTTERDAKLALRLNRNFLKGSKVMLHKSSMAEVEHKLQSLLKRKNHSPMQPVVKRPKPSPHASVLPLNAKPHNPITANLPSTTACTLAHNTADLLQTLHPDTSDVLSLDSNTAFLLGVCTVLEGLQSYQRENNEAVPRVDFPKAESTVVVSDEVTAPEPTLISKPGYVRLFGLPASATKEVICHFFRGLAVREAITNVKLGVNHCCLVKFANAQDACEALLFNKQSLGPNCVEVRGATERMWTRALQECENALDVGERVKPKQSPLRETANYKQQSNSALQIKKQSVNSLPSRSPKKPRPDGDSTTALSTAEYIVRVSNLPKTMTKTEIKVLFGCPNIAHNCVLHLLDKRGNRTDTAFLIFNCTEDYDYAVNLTGCHVGSEAIEVISITRKTMEDMMFKTHHRSLNHCLKKSKNKKPSHKRESDPVEPPDEAASMNPDPAAQTCLFVRNMPADVQKSQIRSLFWKHKLRDDNITLLRNSDGKGIGEAVVQFKSQKLAELAQRLHGQDFLGTKVLLTLINVKQTKDIFATNA